MRVSSLLVLPLVLPAALSLQLRTGAGVVASAVPPPPTTEKPAAAADCVTVAKEGIKQVFESVDEIQTVLDGLDDGSKCKLDQASIDKAIQKHGQAQEAQAAAERAAEEAAAETAPCCKVPLSEIVAAKEEGRFPKAVASCPEAKAAQEKLDALKNTAAAQPAIVQAAEDNIKDVTDSANAALNKCICDAQAGLDNSFKKLSAEEAEKRPAREKTILLQRQVICTNENAADAGKVDACDDLKLSTEDIAKLDLTKPKLAEGLVCVSAEPATGGAGEPVTEPATGGAGGGGPPVELTLLELLASVDGPEA